MDTSDEMRLQLHKLAAENNVVDNTELIRKLKHSEILKKDVQTLLQLKKTHNSLDMVHFCAISECSFLFTYYTDIYNKVKNDEMDLTMLFELLDVLKRIEDGLIDQHDGLFEFGKLFKQICYDSAVRKADKLNENHKEPERVQPTTNMSWNEFKKMAK